MVIRLSAHGSAAFGTGLSGRPRKKEPRFMAPQNGANTICTNNCRPGRTLEMEREQLGRASLHNNILYICPNAKVIRINERNHYDGDLQKHRATHVQKAFPAAEMRLVSSVRFSSSVLQPPIDKGLRTSIHSCRMAVDCLRSTSLGCMTEKNKEPYAFAFQGLLPCLLT